MLKLIASFFAIVLLSSQVNAAVVNFVTSPDGLGYEAKITSADDTKSVSFYENDKWLGNYQNLIIDEASISSSLVPTVGGGVALAIESDGSRNKYDVLAPIELIDGRLYMRCLYKNVFDSVEQTRSVGTVCERQDLKQFDVFASINTKGLFTFTVNQKWLRDLRRQTCPQPVGFQLGQYRIVRCSDGAGPEESRLKIIAFDLQNKLMFSIRGYEFFPRKNDLTFFLSGSSKDNIIAFEGNFMCYEKKSNPLGALHGSSKIDDGQAIEYTLAIENGCLNGHYKHAGSAQETLLKGVVADGRYYLLQLGADNAVGGIFILNHIENGMRGAWTAAPPRKVFEVNVN
jgi:hypothetical protein